MSCNSATQLAASGGGRCVQGSNGVVVEGKRWLLQKQALERSRPFPSRGRVTARHGGCSAEALLELPAAETKGQDGLAAIPASLWVTIGLLAQDGFALQVKLKRAAKPTERDRTHGTWHVYHAVGGAITLRESVKKPDAKAAPKVQTVTQARAGALPAQSVASPRSKAKVEPVHALVKAHEASTLPASGSGQSGLYDMD